MVAAALSEALQAPALPALMVVGTAIWSHFDAKKHQLGRYRTGLLNPEVVAIGCILLWIVAFPWYLSTRHRIRTGQMPLKNRRTEKAPSPALIRVLIANPQESLAYPAPPGCDTVFQSIVLDGTSEDFSRGGSGVIRKSRQFPLTPMTPREILTAS